MTGLACVRFTTNRKKFHAGIAPGQGGSSPESEGTRADWQASLHVRRRQRMNAPLRAESVSPKPFHDPWGAAHGIRRPVLSRATARRR